MAAALADAYSPHGLTTMIRYAGAAPLGRADANGVAVIRRALLFEPRFDLGVCKGGRRTD